MFVYTIQPVVNLFDNRLYLVKGALETSETVVVVAAVCCDAVQPVTTTPKTPSANGTKTPASEEDELQLPALSLRLYSDFILTLPSNLSNILFLTLGTISSVTSAIPQTIVFCFNQCKLCNSSLLSRCDENLCIFNAVRCPCVTYVHR